MNVNKKKSWLEYLEIITLLLVAIISILVGVLDLLGLIGSTFLKDRTLPLTLIVVGILSAYLLIERRGILSKLQNSLDELNNSNKIDQILAVVNRNGAFFENIGGDRFSELKLVYGLRNYSNTVHSDRIICSKDQVFDLWNETLREANTFLAFNYVNHNEVWATKGWAYNTAHTAQLSRLKEGCTIKRIFIVDNEWEFQQLNEILKLQTNAGMEVRWILKKDLRTDKLFKEYLKEIGSMDYVAIDNDLVFTADLNRSRKIDGCTLIKNEDLNKKATYVFNETFHQAKHFDNE